VHRTRHLYTLTLPEGVTAKTNGISDTSFYAGEMVTVTAPEDTDTKKFEKWTGGENIIEVDPNWRNSKTFTFKMPEGNVTLTADYKQLYNLTVTGGTIVGGNGDTGNYLPGTEVTIVFTESGDTTKQFEKWTYTGTAPAKPDGGWTAANDSTSKTFTFKMPAGDVTLTAKYKTAYTLTVDGGKGTILVNGVAGNRALAGDQITVTETGSDKYHLFNSWQLTSSTPLVEPSENWQTSKEFTFTMPAGNVTLTADYKQLYNLTVTGGTIVDGNGDTGIYLPGTKVTVCFTDSDDITKQFKQWTYTGTAPEEPDGGWTSENDKNSKTFTFKMPKGNVTLTAKCKTAYTLTVDGGRGSFTVNGAARTQALEGETVTVKTSDTFFNAYHQFNGWSLSDDSAQMVEPSENWQTSKEFTFTMPAGNVTLKADYKQLYDLAVTGGTIVDESGDTGETTGIYLPGTEVTIQFTESDEITEQFKQWTGGENITDADPANWQNSKRFTFTMPDSAVTLTAVYRETYHLSEYTNKAEFFVNDQQVHQAPAGVRVTVKLVDGFINDHREFDQWLPAGGTALVNPDEGWEHKPSFSFIMPEGSVLLQAHTTFLYDVIVTHGTIVDGTGDTGTSQKIVKPGQLVTVRAESTEENPFLQWTYTGKAPVAPDDGWPEGGWQTSPEFTFKMPNGDVTLEAQRDQLYKVSINDSLGSVTINGEPRSSLWVKEGDTVTVATTLKDGYWMEFEKWNSTGTAPEEPEGGWTETNKSTSTTFTFKMPNGPVELVAQWSASPVARPDPDEPLDEDFGVEPAPMDTTGGTIAAVAVGGAAIWGGYEIATRVILHSLLPEGTVIPASRGQLALLVWNTAGRPEPAGAPAFADVTDPDMAKAAQWCTEQGTMAAKGDRFEPEGWTPKFKVIEVWNKTFPAA
jgi:aspartate 1-decarboxylase